MKKILTMLFLFLIGTRSDGQLAPSDYVYKRITNKLQDPMALEFIALGDTAIVINGWSKFFDPTEFTENEGYLVTTTGDTILAVARINQAGDVFDLNFRDLYPYDHLQELSGGQFFNIVLDPNTGELYAGIDKTMLNFGTHPDLPTFTLAQWDPSTMIWDFVYPTAAQVPAPLYNNSVARITFFQNKLILGCATPSSGSGVARTWTNPTTYTTTLGGQSILAAHHLESSLRWNDTLFFEGMNLSSNFDNRAQFFASGANQMSDKKWFDLIHDPANIFSGNIFKTGFANNSPYLLVNYYRTGYVNSGGSFISTQKVLKTNKSFTTCDSIATWAFPGVTLDTTRPLLWADTITGDVWVYTDPDLFSFFGQFNGYKSMMRSFDNDVSLLGFARYHNGSWSKPVLHTDDGGTIDVIFAMTRALGEKLIFSGRVVYANGDTAYALFSQELPGTTLPVTLTDFWGEKFGLQNKLTWKTEAEVNITAYSVLKSEDGTRWEKFAEVPAHGGSFVANYEAFDDIPDSREYYRLLIHSVDGSIEYSNIIIIERATENIISLYPSPATDHIMFKNLTIDEVHVCKIFNPLGQIVKVEQNIIGNALVVDVSDLASGMYLASVGTVFFNFVKQ